nr:ABC transporter permease [uncultured Fretibacterium sp.]
MSRNLGRPEAETWSLKRIAIRKYLKNRAATTSLVLLLILVVSAVFAPIFATHDISATNLRKILQPPSSEHLLGTDNVGRDVFSRLLFGGRITVLVSVCSMLLQLFIGSTLGAIAGYFSGIVDMFMARATDAVMSFPFLVISMSVLVVLDSSTFKLIMVIGLLMWPRIFRVVRAEVIRLKNMDYVLSARALGLSACEVLVFHLLPNMFSLIVVSCTLSIAQGILIEASMSFLGLGVQPPQPSWGNMLSAAQNMSIFQHNWWLWIPAGSLVVITALAFNFVGEGLRDALDPMSMFH